MQQDLSRFQQQTHLWLYGRALWTIVAIILMTIWVTVANSPEAATANPYSTLPLVVLMVVGFYFIVRLVIDHFVWIRPVSLFSRAAMDGTLMGLALTIPVLVLHDMVLLNMSVPMWWSIHFIVYFGVPFIMVLYFFRSAYSNTKKALIPDGVFYAKAAVEKTIVIAIWIQVLVVVIAAFLIEHVVF